MVFVVLERARAVAHHILSSHFLEEGHFTLRWATISRLVDDSLQLPDKSVLLLAAAPPPTSRSGPVSFPPPPLSFVQGKLSQEEVDKVWEHFHALDTDDSGFLEFDEVSAERDANNDGMIDIHEIRSARRRERRMSNKGVNQ